MTISAYMYNNIKIDNIDNIWTPTATLTLVVETRVLFASRHTYGHFIYERKIKNPVMQTEISERTRPPPSIHNIKNDKVGTSTVTLTIVVKNRVLNTPYIYGYFICKRKITILPCILKFQSGQHPHLLYLYNITNDKVWTPQWRGTRVLFATHHTSMVISFLKEKLKSLHAYWSFRADTTTTVYMYKAGQTDTHTDRLTVRF
jgi:hypothetical protein